MVVHYYTVETHTHLCDHPAGLSVRLLSPVFFSLVYLALCVQGYICTVHNHAVLVMHCTNTHTHNTHTHCDYLSAVINDKHEVIITSGHIFRP